jgi:hypothetical protein
VVSLGSYSRRMSDEHAAHVIDDQGVTETWFVRTEEGWTNSETINIKPGGVLDMGGGMTISNGQTISWSHTVDLG